MKINACSEPCRNSGQAVGALQGHEKERVLPVKTGTEGMRETGGLIQRHRVIRQRHRPEGRPLQENAERLERHVEFLRVIVGAMGRRLYWSESRLFEPMRFEARGVADGRP